MHRLASLYRCFLSHIAYKHYPCLKHPYKKKNRPMYDTWSRDLVGFLYLWGACLLTIFMFSAAVCAVVKTSKLPKLDVRGDLTCMLSILSRCRKTCWSLIGETVPLWIWNSNEINLVIWAACIPTLRPLFLVLFNRPGSDAYGVRKGYQQQLGKSEGFHRSQYFKLIILLRWLTSTFSASHSRA